MSRPLRTVGALLRLAAVGVAVGGSSPALAQSLADRGKAIAQEQCSRCHVVDPARPYTGIESTPSFQLLVTAFPDWKTRFETFFARLPHPSVIRIAGITPTPQEPPTTAPVYLKQEDIDAIVAYATRLKEKADKAKAK